MGVVRCRVHARLPRWHGAQHRRDVRLSRDDPREGRLRAGGFRRGLRETPASSAPCAPGADCPSFAVIAYSPVVHPAVVPSRTRAHNVAAAHGVQARTPRHRAHRARTGGTMMRKPLPLLTSHPTGRSAMTCRYRCGDACFHEVPNTSSNEYAGDVIARALSRRSVLRAGAVVRAAATAVGTALPVPAPNPRPPPCRPPRATRRATRPRQGPALHAGRAEHRRPGDRPRGLRAERRDPLGRPGPARRARFDPSSRPPRPRRGSSATTTTSSALLPLSAQRAGAASCWWSTTSTPTRC